MSVNWTSEVEAAPTRQSAMAGVLIRRKTILIIAGFTEKSCSPQCPSFLEQSPAGLQAGLLDSLSAPRAMRSRHFPPSWPCLNQNEFEGHFANSSWIRSSLRQSGFVRQL